MRKSARTQIPPFFDNDPYILKGFEVGITKSCCILILEYGLDDSKKCRP